MNERRGSDIPLENELPVYAIAVRYPLPRRPYGGEGVVDSTPGDAECNEG